MTPLRSPRAYSAALAACLVALVALPLAGGLSTAAAHTTAPRATIAPAAASPLAASLPEANEAIEAIPAVAPTTVRTGAIDVQAVPADQGIVRAGSDLTLSVVVSNPSSALLPAGTATVYLSAAASDRQQLASWLTADSDSDSDDARLGSALLEVSTPALGAGQSATLEGTVIPAAALGLVEPVTFGPRQLSVVVSVGIATVGAVRTAVTVTPAEGAPVATVTLATPLDVPATGAGLIPSDLLETYTSPGGVLTRQLDQVIGRTVAIGIDPRVIASIRALGDAAPVSATEWLQRLAAAPNDTFPLAYADSDIAATSQSGAGVLVPTSIDLDAEAFPAAPAGAADPSPTPDPTASASPQPGVEPSGQPTPEVDPLPTLDELLEWDYTSTGVAWPTDDTVVTADLDTFAAAGLDTTLLSSSNAGLGEAAASSAATIGEHRISVSDDAISAAFRDAVIAPTTPAWQSAVAELTASLAALAAQGGDATSAIATLGRSVPVGIYRLSDTLAAIEALPWVQSERFSDALRAPAPPTTLVESPVDADRIAQLESLLAAEDATNQFATVLESPALITGERRLSLLAVSSQAWIGQDDTWATAVAEYRTRSSEILTSVQIEQSSDLLLPSQNGDLPISVSNALPYPVTVYVTVLPQTPILNVLDSNVVVTIEANSQKRAPVPVQSVANGDVTIAVSLTSAAGVSISQPVFTTISVQAQWETAAVAVLATLIVGVFAFGIVRTVRRRLRARRAGAPTAAETESPAQISAQTPENDG